MEFYYIRQPGKKEEYLELIHLVYVYKVMVSDVNLFQLKFILVNCT